MRGLRDSLLGSPSAGAACAALVALVLYLPSLGAGFTYDDRVTVVENRFITESGNLPKLIGPEYFRGAEEKTWRPVTTLSYFFDFALWGKNPFGYHLTSVLLHALTAALVVLLLAAWRAPPPVALLSGLAFALHPVATAVVDAVSFRDDLLAALFVVGGLYLYRLATRPEAPRRAALWGAALLYGLACLSKENAVVLPALAWALDVLLEGRPLVPKERSRAVALGSLAAVGLAYLGLRFGPMAGPAETYRYLETSPSVALLTAPAVLFRAARLLVLPLGLSPVRWVEPVHSPADPLAAAGLVLLAAGCFLGWRWRRRSPRVASSLAWMGIAWLPVSGIVPLTHPLGDRYLYLPLVGFAWLLSEGLWSLWSMESKVARGGAAALAAAVALGWGFLTVERHRDWKDELSLWSSSVANEPASYRAHYNLGDALYKAGRLEEAELSYRRSLELKPVFSLGHYSLGRLLYRTGRKDEAVEQFASALADQPEYAEAHNHLGLIFAERGDLERARAEYEAALKDEPSNANALNNLGIMAARGGRASEAEALFRRATAASPYDPVGYSNLGTLLAEMGRSGEAASAFRRALELSPGHEPARRGLAALTQEMPARKEEERDVRQRAVALARAGKLAEATQVLEDALAERPGDAVLRHTLAVTLIKAGRYQEARRELETIVETSPGDVLALTRLASLDRRDGRPEDAVRRLDAALASRPTDVSLLVERGLTLGQASRLAEAEETLRRALSLKPDFAPAHEALGRVLLARRRPAEAASAFQRALELEPSLELSRRGLAEARRLSQGR